LHDFILGLSPSGYYYGFQKLQIIVESSDHLPNTPSAFSAVKVPDPQSSVPSPSLIETEGLQET
jgi:hypothetical protein